MGKHKLFRCGVLITAVLIFCVSFSLLYHKEKNLLNNNTQQIKTYRLNSMDGYISAEWAGVFSNQVQTIEYTIHGTDGYTEKRTLNPNETLVFHNGNHGTLYEISMCGIYPDGTKSDSYTDSALFLRYDKLPALPTITIETVNHEQPIATDKQDAPDNNWGITMTTKEYVRGSLCFSGEQTIKDVGMEIRVRGNTSSLMKKTPYKIKLDVAQDFISDGDSHPSEEWILLASGSNLYAYTGSYIANLCKMEWQPKMMFVNLIVNNDWKGSYILIEQIEKSPYKVDVADDGYIFESDAYWWNADGLYFKTEHQHPALGYTFIYPKIRTGEDTACIALQQHVQTAENAIMQHDPNLSNLIDFPSFAGWVMARDICGQGDAGGSNMYYYVNSLSKDQESRKIKMGPLWDFDTINAVSEQWSLQHLYTVAYFPTLFQIDSFKAEYKALWTEIYPTLMSKISAHLDALAANQGDALQKSWELDASRWGYSTFGVSSSIADMKAVLEKQIQWINQQITQDIF